MMHISRKKKKLFIWLYLQNCINQKGSLNFKDAETTVSYLIEETVFFLQCSEKKLGAKTTFFVIIMHFC